MSEAQGYWGLWARRRLSRRQALAGGAAGVGGLALSAACGTQRTGTQPAKPAASSGSGQTAQETPQTGGNFNFYEIGNPTLNPHTNARYWTMKAVGGVMSRLLRYKAGADPQIAANRDVQSDLALSMESPDGITWTVKLRPDAAFQSVAPVNGRLVDAEDVKATFVAALTNPKNANRESLGMIDETKIEAPAKDTVVFHLKYPYAPFRKTVASPTYSWIFPREAFSGGYDPEKQVIGSGPFLFESFTPDVAALYKRNPNWFEKGRPYVDSIRHAIVTDNAARLAQFTGGNLDSITVEDTDLETMKKNRPTANLTTYAPTVPGWVFGQLGDASSVWSDIRVRRAVSMAIDRDSLAKVVATNGSERQMVVGVAFGKWALKPQDLPADTAQYYKYDPAGAKKLLEAAGHQNFEFKFVYTNNGYNATFNKTAETINGMLSAAGFKTKLVTIDYQREYVGGGKGVRYGAIANDSMAYGLTSGFDDPDEILFNYFNSKSNLRNTNVKDASLDAMIEKQRTLLDENERLKSVIDIQKYLADKAYLVAGLPTAYGYNMTQPWVHNFPFTTSYGMFTESFSGLFIKK